MTFANGQIVSGKVTGKFVVVKSELRKADGMEIVTVKQISEEGHVSSSKMKFPADCLIG
jgi:hypothetical protein